MKRLMTMSIVAALALATATMAMAEPVSTYKKTSYDDGGVVLRMSQPMGSVFNPGEEIAFTYQTTDDAYVVVFNIDTEGYVHLIHPGDGAVFRAAARKSYAVPSDRSERLLVGGETGVEFVFALTVPDRAFLDEQELAYLLRMETLPRSERYRIDGDPFLAANIIAGELVRGISHRPGIYLDYTYFFINQRVDHPCYLCGECEGQTGESLCEAYRIVANFERRSPMAYPLRRAYDMVSYGDDVDVAATQDRTYDTGDQDVNVNFYPYEVEVRYVTRPAMGFYWDSYSYDPFWWDPWGCGWVYYPTYSYPYYHNYYRWSWWYGPWGGYYCSSWYYPRYGGYYDCWRDYYYTDRNRRSVEKFKSGYKDRGSVAFKGDRSGSLLAVRDRTVKRDGKLRIASKDVQSTRVRGRTDLARNAYKRVTTRGQAGVKTTRVRGATRSFDRPTSRSKPGSIRGDNRRGTIRKYTPRSGTRPKAGIKRTDPRRRSKPAVKRSDPRRRSKPAVKRSDPRRRSKPAVKRGGSSRRSKPAVKRSSRSSSRSSKARSSSKGSSSRGKSKSKKR